MEDEENTPSKAAVSKFTRKGKKIPKWYRKPMSLHRKEPAPIRRKDKTGMPKGGLSKFWGGGKKGHPRKNR